MALSLLVELGACANEWRGFKFWSHDQEPRFKKCEDSLGDKIKGIYDDEECFCENASYPLLEEYVDGLHFILELGIEMGFKNWGINPLSLIKHHTITKQFNYLFNKIGDFEKYRTVGKFDCITDAYVGLGEMLGFTWDQVENAYYAKNKINHQRQNEGY
ncbi:dUTP diphosphatase [Peribacillus butanolivorans]|uniref:dUTP diphosphatase n=1 Tax=Peribacillus butanolivorans TaxID=421767 RepID=UPI0036DD528E